MPGPGAREGVFLRPGIEPAQQLRFELDEEQHFGRDPVCRAPGQPVPGVDADLRMDEPVGEWRRYAVHDRAVLLAVAAGDDRSARRELVFADPALKAELEQGDLDHGDGRRQLFEIDEELLRAVGGRKEGRRRPAGAAALVAPRDAAQVDGIKEGAANVHVVVG